MVPSTSLGTLHVAHHVWTTTNRLPAVIGHLSVADLCMEMTSSHHRALGYSNSILSALGSTPFSAELQTVQRCLHLFLYNDFLFACHSFPHACHNLEKSTCDCTLWKGRSAAVWKLICDETGLQRPKHFQCSSRIPFAVPCSRQQGWLSSFGSPVSVAFLVNPICCCC